MQLVVRGARSTDAFHCTSEGQRPINVMTDKTFELMCNPENSPYGMGHFLKEDHKNVLVANISNSVCWI